MSRRLPERPRVRAAEVLEHLAGDLVAADTGSPDSFAALCGQLDALAKVAASENRADVAAVAGSAARHVRQQCSQPGADCTKLSELFERTVSGLQNMLQNACGPEQADLPPEVFKPPADHKPLDTPAEPDTPVIDDPALVSGFVTEGGEHLDNAEQQLLALERNLEDAEAINAVFRAFHTVKGVAAFLGLDGIRTLAHDAETLLDRARRGGIALSPEDVDLGLEAVDGLRTMVDEVGAGLKSGAPLVRSEAPPHLLSRLQHAADPEKALAHRDERPSQSPSGGAATVEQAVEQRARRAVRETVRIDAARLDQLLDAVGELVIAESTVSQSPEIREAISPQLERQLTLLDKITRELQDITTSLRMMPVRNTFRKMERLVRDLAHRFGREIEFTISGEDTELDKTMVELLGDPLVHMLRNSVDHGIEPAAERQAAGKPSVGHIDLRAYHRGGNVYIEVEDDGRGLDREAILRKARAQGLVEVDESLSAGEIYALAFRPGVSTAAEITDVSGRGVGLDVVKRNIEMLRGNVEVSSTEGQGTRFTLRLPLTLAIIDGLVVRVDAETFIVPALNVVRAVHPGPGELQTALGRAEMLRYHGDYYPVYRLHNLIGATHERRETQGTERRVALVAEEQGRMVALLADEVVNKQQFVIKSLGSGIGETPGVAGCAVMPDGSVGLILSVSGLVKLALGTGAPGAQRGGPDSGLANVQ